MTIDSLHSGTAATQAARIIDNFAPKLERLWFVNEVTHTDEDKIHAAWAEFQSAEGCFKNADGTQIRMLVLDESS